MYDYISGKIAETTPTYAVIDCGGIGYEININLIDYTCLQDKKETKLYIHESIREDAHTLYGFLSKRGREIFRLLIGVSGVGANTARLIMSSLTVRDIENVIATGQESMLKAVKGIGGKTAQRIIIDLKDKIKVSDDALFSQAQVSTPAFDEALAAMLMLGFAKAQSEKVLKKIFSDAPAISVEQAITKALKML
ncbi:MAG: Holliday junction branch migration protein RuvA [Prevotella sp.]|nr:Holliday junction branch migration protein RuvA [Prevotella sp.]MCM1074639.1 Holliday junction branch migration protein RuvA [Ruminococcus sp.]